MNQPGRFGTEIPRPHFINDDAARTAFQSGKPERVFGTRLESAEQTKENRRLAIMGVFETVGTYYEQNGLTQRLIDAFHLTDADLTSPEAKKLAEEAFYGQTTDGCFAVAAAIQSRAKFNNEFFRRPDVLGWLRMGIRRIRYDLYQNIRAFSDLTKLPIDESFFQDDEIQNAARIFQANALRSGRTDAIEVMRRIGMPEESFKNSELREAVDNGMLLLAERGDIETYQAYSAAFEMQKAPSHIRMSSTGYLKLIELGKLDEALAVREYFMDVRPTSDIHAQGFGKKGVEQLLTQGDFDEARRLITYTQLSVPNVEEAAKEALLRCLTEQKEQIVRRLQTEWLIPAETTCQVTAEAITRTMRRFRDLETLPSSASLHMEIKAILDISNLSDELVHDAMVNGLESLLTDEVAKRGDALAWAKGPIFPMVKQLIADSNGTQEDVRRIGKATVEMAFNKGKTDVVRPIADAMSLDETALRAAAIGAANRLFDGQMDEKTVKTLQAIRGYPYESPIQWKETENACTRSVESVLTTQYDVSLAQQLGESFRMPTEEFEACLTRTREFIRKSFLAFVDEKIDDGSRSTAIPNRIAPVFRAYEFDWGNFGPDEIPWRWLVEFQDPAFQAAVGHDPWYASLRQLLGVQGRVSREEYDPWLTDFIPMVSDLLEKGALDRRSPHDARLLFEYVKTFGMVRLNTVVELYLELKRQKSVAALPEKNQKTLRAAIGNKVVEMSGESAINELRKLRAELQRDLIEDRVPKRPDASVVGELVIGLCGSTDWGVAAEPSEIIARWNETAKQNPELAQIPDGYRERMLVVPKIYRRKSKEEPEKTTGLEAASFWAARTGRVVRWFEDTSGNGIPWLEEIVKMHFLDESGSYPHAELTLSTDNERAYVRMLEQLAGHANGQVALETLIGLSMRHVLATASEGWRAELEKLLRADPTSRENALGWANFVRDYLREHYLHPEQRAVHTGHEPFSDTLRSALERAWDVTGDPSGHALERLRAVVEKEQKEQTALSSRTMNVSLVPVRGLGRVFAGNIGDSCIANRHEELARGEYPGIISYLFVTNRGTPSERIQGSVLFIETKTADGRSILVVRANNPRKNLLAQVDADELVQQTLNVAIDVAKRCKFDLVGVVRDGTSGASSNRDEVSNFYSGNYASAKPIQLVDEPETNFNEYAIWNPAEHPVVPIWSNPHSQAGRKRADVMPSPTPR